MQGTPVYAFETRDGQQVRVYSADREDEARLSDLIDRATPENSSFGRSQPSRYSVRCVGCRFAGRIRVDRPDRR